MTICSAPPIWSTRRWRLRDQLRFRLHRWSAQIDLAIKTLRYNALLEQVQVGIAGELDRSCER